MTKGRRKDSKHPTQAMRGAGRKVAPDGVGTARTHGRRGVGESNGGAYPNPHRGKKPHHGPDSFMGHGGQTEIAYHGSGQLGETDVEGVDNPNSPAKSN
ncbi:MAG TPA: hypothetical protein VL918_12300 [Sphingobium sp.]|nr:hypothetical protein [Sphingobium sp.]